MTRTSLALVALCSLVCSTASATLVVSTSNPPGTPLVMNAGQSNIGTVTYSVAYVSGESRLYRYDTTLTLVPAGGATGLVTFASVNSAPGAPFSVSNFSGTTQLLGSQAFFGADNGNTVTNLTIGAAVPLANFTFNANGAASGLFNIVLTSKSFEYDGDGSFPFEVNPTNPANSTIIGQIQVNAVGVPEASSFLFGGIITTLGGVVAWRKRARA